MKVVHFELTDYICMYVNQNGYVDCVLCSDLKNAYNVYGEYDSATIINIDCTRNTRTIVEQKTKNNTKQIKNGGNKMIGKKAIIDKIEDGLGYPSNDKKYISEGYEKIVKLVSLFPGTTDFYITDLFIPKYANENNDYISSGFLVVSERNISLVEQ